MYATFVPSQSEPEVEFEQFLYQETDVDWNRVESDRYENEASGLAIVFLRNQPPDQPLQLLEAYDERHWRLVQLWEDVWQTHTEVVKSRIRALLGKSLRINARLTIVQEISQQFLNSFLQEHHLQQSVKCKYRYGLFLKPMPQNEAFLKDPSISDRCVAVAGFGPIRKMPSRGEDHASGELIRFANVRNHTVVGGLDKLLQAFLKDHPVQDLMTYADRDWSGGQSYERLGFTRVDTTPPQEFWLNPDTGERIAPHRREGSKPANWKSVYNSGNYKYIKTLQGQ